LKAVTQGLFKFKISFVEAASDLSLMHSGKFQLSG